MRINVTDEIKGRCWNYLQNNTMANRGEFDGDKIKQFTGLVGEVVVGSIFGHPISFGDGFDGGYDFMIGDLKVDVKTMGRNVEPRDYYVNNFVGFQKDYDCDIYIFTSLNKKTSMLTICGWVTKEELFNRSEFYEKGEVRHRGDGSKFKTEADLYEIENSDLNSISELINKYKNSLK